MSHRTTIIQPVVRVSFRQGYLLLWGALVALLLVTLLSHHRSCVAERAATLDTYTNNLAALVSRLFQRDMGGCSLQFEAVSGLLKAKHQQALRELAAPGATVNLTQLKQQLNAELETGETIDVALISPKLVITDTTYAPEQGLDMSTFPDVQAATREVTESGAIRIDYPIFESTHQDVRAYSLSALPAGTVGGFLQLGYKNAHTTQTFRSLREAFLPGGTVIALNLYVFMQDPGSQAGSFMDIFGDTLVPAPEVRAQLEAVRHSGQRAELPRLTAEGRYVKDLILPLRPELRGPYAGQAQLKPSLVLKVTMDLTDEWQRTRRAFWLTLLAAAAFIGLSLPLLVWQHRRFVGPLTMVVGSISRSEPIPVTAVIQKNAELGILARCFNSHLERMENKRAKLATTTAELNREVEERKAAEAGLLKAHEELEARIAERTTALNAANTRLTLEIADRKLAQEKLVHEQRQLRLLASQLALAEEHERRRIATGLHDDVGQMLALVKIKLAGLRAATVNRDAWVVGVKELLDLLDQTIRSTRSLTFELCSPVLQDLGFEMAVQNLCEHVQAQHGIRFTFENDAAAKPVDRDFAVLLFRMVRELVMNVVKHAGASQVTVRLERAGDCLAVVVRDNGKGFAPAAGGERFSPAGGFGLMNVRERACQSGGTLDIASAPGQGSTVTLRVPLLTA